VLSNKHQIYILMSHLCLDRW